MNVYLQGRRLSLKPSQLLGSGGEADVYDIGSGVAAKIFKQHDHPDYSGNPASSAAAKARLLEHQQKLRDFPTALPERVIKPENLVYDSKQRDIVGYTMRLLSGATVMHHYGEPSSRLAGVDNTFITRLFRDLHHTVSTLHNSSVIIGDFNDLNVLTLGHQAYLIDADSFQFDRYLCSVFTDSFVDPLLCKENESCLQLQKPYGADGDWYSFATMLFSSLLCVNPYGGVYKPKPGEPQIPPAARPLERITVFHPSVKYPKPALPFITLPDDLLDYFHKVFEEDVRGIFPEMLLQMLEWKVCSHCSRSYAKAYCPFCQSAPPLRSQTPVAIRGGVCVTEIFSTSGVILAARGVGVKLRYLVHHDREFRREDNSIVCSGSPVPGMSYELLADETAFAKEGVLTILRDGNVVDRLQVDHAGSAPTVSSSPGSLLFAQEGTIYRRAEYGLDPIGNVLQNRTRFWAGTDFGFGFYQAGEMNVGIVFDTQGQGINDSVELPRIVGQFLHGQCAFSSRRCWFRYVYRRQGKTFLACAVISRGGTVEGFMEAEEYEETWLRDAGEFAAVGDMLLASTDEGIIRIELIGGTPVKTREFPDTEPFIKRSSQIFPAKEGLYVVDDKQVRLMTIA